MFFLPKDSPELVQNGPYAPYSAAHIIIILFAFGFIWLLLRIVRQKSIGSRLVWVAAVYGSLVLLNILRVFWEVSTGSFDVKTSLPLELCGIQMFVLPLALFSRGKIQTYMRDLHFRSVRSAFSFHCFCLLPRCMSIPSGISVPCTV